jgi:hypothetical protein
MAIKKQDARRALAMQMARQKVGIARQPPGLAKKAVGLQSAKTLAPGHTKPTPIGAPTTRPMPAPTKVLGGLPIQERPDQQGMTRLPLGRKKIKTRLGRYADRQAGGVNYG